MVSALLIVSSAGAYILYKNNETLKTKNTELTGKVVSLESDIKVYQATENAVLLGQMLADGEKEAFAKLLANGKAELKREEARIKKEIQDPLEQARALSKARMDSVWANYCQLQPTNATCVKMAYTANKEAAEGVKK